LTHTHTGGKLYDRRLGSGEAAYGWKRCKQASDPDNAGEVYKHYFEDLQLTKAPDSMVQLAVAWKVYSLGQFYINEDGQAMSR
jgi:hypothetical protein